MTGSSKAILSYQYDLQVVPYFFLSGLILDQFWRKGLSFWPTETMTFTKCKTFIRLRSGCDESLIHPWLMCHNNLLALNFNRKCFCQLFTSLTYKSPETHHKALKTCTTLLSSLALEWEHFKLARPNRWRQQIWASSWTSHSISFELPSLVSVLIRLP